MSRLEIERDWHTLTVEKTLDYLKTSKNGLSTEEAKKRLSLFGPNRIEEYRTKSPIYIFLNQFKDFVVIILIVAAVISGSIGLIHGTIEEIYDTILITLILILNALIGTYQELKAEKAVVSLKRYIKLLAKVVRDGKVLEVDSEELVPGDIVLLESGDKIPADMRIIESVNLQIDESLLTGESTPVSKEADITLAPETPVSDRVNMAFMGTTVTYGSGIGVVVKTGLRTEIGKIAELIHEVETPETPLKTKTKLLGKQLSIIFLIVTGIVFLEGLLTGEELVLMFLTAVSLAVAAVPEGLPVFITLILAISSLEMARRQAIVKNLQAVETLGSTTVICSDKTGTLTENQMTVVEIYTLSHEVKVTGSGYKPVGEFLSDGSKISPLEFPDLRWLLISGRLCNKAVLVEENGEYKVVGDPLEGALITLYEKAVRYSRNSPIEAFKRVNEFPFDSIRKRMSVVYEGSDGKCYVFVKGSPESILEISTKVQSGDRVLELTEEDRKIFLEKVNEMAQRALRTLAIGYKLLDGGEVSVEEAESDIIMVGIVGMLDPPRPDVSEFVRKAKNAGIRVKMVTGDHAITASTIARMVGILEEGDNDSILTSYDLESMTIDELVHLAERVKVYARVAPDHKLKIVQAYQRRGEVVAMTGDGVNDAPALKLADVGVAMGKRGTDVAREAADLILLEESFSTIIKAIEVGRRTFENIRKTINFLISSNISEIMIVFLAFLFGLPLPLLPIQILWVNLVTDGAPALGLSVDVPEGDVMNRPPRPPKEPLMRRFDLFRVLWISGIITSISLMLFWLTLPYGESYARTVAFTTLVFAELFNSIGIRTERESVVSVGFFANKMLLVSIPISLLLQLAIIYAPFLTVFFHTTPISLQHMFYIVILSSLVLVLEELRKFVFRRLE